MKKQIIPDAPTMPVVITSEIRQRLESWIRHICAVSPLIAVKSVLDEKFDTAFLLEQINNYLSDGDSNISIEIPNLRPEDICMYVAFNRSTKEEEKRYAINDLLVFCYENKAFFVQHGFDYIEEDTELERKAFQADYYSWQDRLNIFLKYFQEFTQKVPPLG